MKAEYGVLQMKINLILCFMCLQIFCTLSCYSMGVLCNSDNSMCSAGHYNSYGHNIYVNEGVMCTSDMGMCTNGFAFLRTSGVVKKNKKPEPPKDVLTNEAEEVLKFAELYEKGLISQIEFNRKKSNINIYKKSEADELKKFAELYAKGVITKAEYNKEKAKILK